MKWYRKALGLRVLVRHVVDDGYALFEAGETRLALFRKNAGEAGAPLELGLRSGKSRDGLSSAARRRFSGY